MVYASSYGPIYVRWDIQHIPSTGTRHRKSLPWTFRDFVPWRYFWVVRIFHFHDFFPFFLGKPNRWSRWSLIPWSLPWHCGILDLSPTKLATTAGSSKTWWSAFRSVSDMRLAIQANFLIMMWAAFARALPCSEGCDPDESSVLLQTHNKLKEDTDAKSIGGWKRWRRSRRHNGPHYYARETSTSTTTSTSTDACRCVSEDLIVFFDRTEGITEGTLSSCETQKIFVFNVSTASLRPDSVLPECCCGTGTGVFSLQIDDFTTTLPFVPTLEVISPNDAIVDFDIIGSPVSGDDLRFRYGATVGAASVPIEQIIGFWILKFSYMPGLQGQDFVASFSFDFKPFNLQTCEWSGGRPQKQQTMQMLHHIDGSHLPDPEKRTAQCSRSRWQSNVYIYIYFLYSHLYNI